MNKKLVSLLIFCISILLLVGCTKEKIYTVQWDGWELLPNNPVVNESVFINIKFLRIPDGNRTIVYHWVITEGESQKTFITLDAGLRITFDTPGKKEVFLWAEGVNYGESFQAKPYFFDFEVVNITK